MLQLNTNSLMNTYRLFDLQGKSVSSANAAAWLVCVCLNNIGLSGCLGPFTFICITEYPD